MHSLKSESSLKTIQSKFGDITINLNNQINFPQGILGFPAYKNYCLVECPVEKFKSFVLLQSSEENELMFMVYPLNLDTQTMIKEEDIEEGCTQANISDRSSLLILLVAGTKLMEDTGQKVITVNTKAPIFMDVKAKTAAQVVFQTGNYDVQHIL